MVCARKQVKTYSRRIPGLGMYSFQCCAKFKFHCKKSSFVIRKSWMSTYQLSESKSNKIYTRYWTVWLKKAKKVNIHIGDCSPVSPHSRTGTKRTIFMFNLLRWMYKTCPDHNHYNPWLKLTLQYITCRS